MNDGFRVIAVDFDGTLVEHVEGRPVMPEGLYEALAGLVSRGVHVGIATGRDWWDLRDLLLRLGIPWGWPFPTFVIARQTYVYWLRNGRQEPDEEWNGARMAEATCRSKSFSVRSSG